MVQRLRTVVLGGVLVSAVAAGGCATGPGAVPARLRGTTVYALLADNQLVAVSLARGAIQGRVRLAAAPREIVETTHAMAVSADGRALYVLVGPGGADRVAVVDPASLAVRASYRLEAPTVYHALALGPRSGRLYLVGNRPDQQGGLSAWATVLDPRGGRVIASRQVHPAGGRDWLVYSASVSPDERRLLVSYHGARTSGADVFQLGGDRLDGCGLARAAEGLGCLAEIHGLAVDRGGPVIATDGHRILRLSGGGAVPRRWDPRLPGNHVTEFALAAGGTRLYVVGSCGYTGGMSLLDLRRGGARVLVPAVRPDGAAAVGTSAAPAAARVCGQRVETAPAGVLAVGRIQRAVPQPDLEGSVLLVDAASGRVRHAVPTPAEPVDLLVASPPA